MQHRYLSPAGDVLSQNGGLVESSLKAPPPMQRHRDHGVKALVERQGPRQISAQRTGQRFHPVVLQKMDQFQQRALIESETVGGVEPPRARAAQCAPAFKVEWK
jgi:hypothetical protein